VSLVDARRTARGRDLRLVPAAIGAWVVGLALTALPDAGGIVAASAWAIAVVAASLALLARHRGGGGVSTVVGTLAASALAVGAVACVATSVALRADIRAPPGLADVRGPQELMLVATEEASAGSDRFRGTASSIGPIGPLSPLGGETPVLRGEMPVLVVDVEIERDIGIGATVRLRGTASPTGPGGGIVAIVVADGAAAEIVAPPPGWIEWGNAMRARFRALAAGLPGDGGALLTGLAIGDDRAVPEPLEASMRASSLTHLTAVSGANCAIVVGAVMVGGALLGIRRRWRITVALVVLGAFVVLVTPQPSVVRAAVMAAFALVGLALARPMRGLPLLGIAIIGILVVDPWAASELGFVLSALATAGLLVLSAPLARGIAFVMPYRLAAAISIPFAAQLAVQPAIAVVDATVPTYGVIANLLAVPAAPVATVLGLLACLAAPVLPVIAGALAWVAWLPSTWIGGVATTFAGLPAARLPWPDGLIGIALYAVIGLGVAVLLLGRGRIRLLGGLAAGVIVAGAAGSIAAERLAVLERPRDWQIAMCDVGQGDAAVIRSDGLVAVVDTGPDPPALERCLVELGISRVDLLVLSHFDRDHAGGAEALRGRVGRVLSGPADADARTRVLEPLAVAGAVVDEAARGDAGVLGELVWQVLWPRDADRPTPGNDASLVVRFARDAGGCRSCVSSIWLGDLGEAAQLRLLSAGAIGGHDVVKVSHHGSADQSERLYLEIGAPVALIGVGADNGYGHPTDRTLSMLGVAGAEVARTDEHGLLLVAREAGGDLTLWRARGAGAP